MSSNLMILQAVQRKTASSPGWRWSVSKLSFPRNWHIAVRNGEIFDLVQGRLILHGLALAKTTGYFESENIKAEIIRLDDLKVTVRRMLAGIISGTVRTPQAELRFFPGGGRFRIGRTRQSRISLIAWRGLMGGRNPHPTATLRTLQSIYDASFPKAWLDRKQTKEASENIAPSNADMA